MFELCATAIPELWSWFSCCFNGSMLFLCRPGYTCCPLALLIFWGRSQSSLVFLKLNLKVSCSFILFYYIITFQTAHTNYSPFAPNAYAVAHEPMFQPQHDGIRPVLSQLARAGQYGPGNGYKLCIKWSGGQYFQIVKLYLVIRVPIRRLVMISRQYMRLVVPSRL